MAIITAVIPILACLILVANHGWLMRSQRSPSTPNHFGDSEHTCAIAAHLLLCWYYSTHMVLALPLLS